MKKANMDGPNTANGSVILTVSGVPNFCAGVWIRSISVTERPCSIMYIRFIPGPMKEGPGSSPLDVM